MNCVSLNFRFERKAQLGGLVALNSKFKATFILCLISICSLSSQVFFFSGDYNYSFNGDLVFGVSKINHETTLNIEFDSIYLFSRKRELLFFDSNETEERLLDTMFIIGSNQDSIRVKFRSEGDERLLYDFNLEVGSTYKIYPDRSTIPGSDSMTVTVLGYGDTLLSGQVVPFQIVQYTFDESPFIIVDNLYKGIGSLQYYFDIFDIFSNQLGGGLGGPLVCYYNQNINFVNENLESEYINEISGECINISTTINHSNEDRTLIYPNPANDYLNISFNNAVQGEFLYIFSSFGVRYIKPLEKSLEGNYLVDVSNLPAGVFYLLIGKKTYRFLKF